MPRPVHFHIPADKPEALAQFYSDALGWTVTTWGGGDYWIVQTGPEDEPGIDGGIGGKFEGDTVPFNTIDVPDLDEYMSRVLRSGGKLLTGKMAITGVGYLVHCEDPEGNRFGLMVRDETARHG
ncbi:MAG: VOC family protein [Armatimonadetes bacterium]|nr:VOC family protein [Armatimonadota bacterium]